MLLHLAEPISHEISPISINRNNSLPIAHEKLSVVGLGSFDPRNSRESYAVAYLRRVQLEVRADDYCNQVFGYPLYTDIMFCAGGPPPGTKNVDRNSKIRCSTRGRDTESSCVKVYAEPDNACYGDSGAPIFDSNTKTLIGLVSFGLGCAREVTGVYSKVSTALGWISTQLGADFENTTPAPSNSPLTELPTLEPTPLPSPSPTHTPSVHPTSNPTIEPSLEPTPQPSVVAAVITDVVLMDAETDQQIRRIVSGDTLYLDDLPPVTIVALATPETQAVDFQWNYITSTNTADSRARRDSDVPFSLGGDNDNDLIPVDLPVGSHTLVLVPYQGEPGSRVRGSPVSVDFAVVAGIAITQLTLYNAGSDEPIKALETGDTLILSELPSELAIVAEATSSTKSVRFDWDRGESRTESTRPYSLGRDRDSHANVDFLPLELPFGKHTLIVTPYSEIRLGGDAGTPVRVEFTVVSDDAPRISRLVIMDATVVPPAQIRDMKIPVDDDWILDDLPFQLTIEAPTEPEIVGSVKFESSWGYEKIESLAPYTMRGDQFENYNTLWFDGGLHTLTVTPYTEGGAKGSAGVSTTVEFRVLAASSIPPMVVTGFNLVRARSLDVIRALNDGDTVFLHEMPDSGFSIAPVTNPPKVGSVRFVLDGEESSQSQFPISYKGRDTIGYFRSTFSDTGVEHTIEATPFAAYAASGPAGTPYTISFFVQP